jgi:hypothetical protein
MALDFNLLSTTIPAEAASSAMKGMQQVNALTAGRLANQASDMEIKNALAEQEAWKGSATPQEAQQNLMRGGFGKSAMAIGKNIADVEKTQMDTLAARLPIQREMAKDMYNDPSDDNIKHTLSYQVNRGWMTPEQAQQNWQKLSNAPVAQRKDFFLTSSTKADNLMQNLETARSHKVTEGISYGNLDVARQTLANASNLDLQENIAAAKSSGTTKGKAIATAQINLPNAIATSEDLVNKIDAMVGKEAKIDKNTKKVLEAGTAPHKGFTGAVGMGSWKAAGIPGVQQYVPGSAAADFKSRYDEIMGGAFLEAFETLKGGGSITETEGKKATAAKTRMNLAQSEGEFLSAAREYQGVVRRGIERAKAKAGGVSGAGPAVPDGFQLD